MPIFPLEALRLNEPCFLLVLFQDFSDGMCSYSSWAMDESAAEWERGLKWPRDSAWAESFWPDLAVGGDVGAVSVYQRETPGLESAVLLSGILLSVGSIALVAVAELAYLKRVKQR